MMDKEQFREKTLEYYEGQSEFTREIVIALRNIHVALSLIAGALIDPEVARAEFDERKADAIAANTPEAWLTSVMDAVDALNSR